MSQAEDMLNNALERTRITQSVVAKHCIRYNQVVLNPRRWYSAISGRCTNVVK
jgi:hypothetical protein